jgi:hypothetical protein
MVRLALAPTQIEADDQAFIVGVVGVCTTVAAASVG